MGLPGPIARVLADSLAPSIARWSSRRELEISAAGGPLDADLQDFADELGITEPAGIRVHFTSEVPLPAPALLIRFAKAIGLPVFHPAGMALGRAIAANRPDNALLRHELVHLAQYQRLGGHLPFMRRYLFECLHHGYLDSPLEIEARESS
ncbi:hypothetical protein [Haloferula sp. A504]|uniref:hypothetical protein n=1 Tax=Haloferula sp. A504 TaxID=3373601 RepID=UPI0031C4898B|nr:hypothetical protein [Verrucomicrobiaceae bacterium E54]